MGTPHPPTTGYDALGVLGLETSTPVAPTWDISPVWPHFLFLNLISATILDSKEPQGHTANPDGTKGSTVSPPLSSPSV